MGIPITAASCGIFIGDITMRFAFIPPGPYKIGQRIQVHGKTMRVESYTHTGRNVTVVSLPATKGFVRFERIVCICTTQTPIGELK